MKKILLLFLTLCQSLFGMQVEDSSINGNGNEASTNAPIPVGVRNSMRRIVPKISQPDGTNRVSHYQRRYSTNEEEPKVLHVEGNSAENELPI